MTGWPSKRNECENLVKPFFNYRDELSASENIVFKGEQLVIPYELRNDILTQLHRGHIGIQGTIRRARDIIFWPGFSNDIKQITSTCPTCQKF